MSGSKLAVLGLSLFSALILFYGGLCALSPVLAPHVFSVYQDPVTQKVEPGCFGIIAFLPMAFIALLPAAAAVWVWRTRVRARAAQEHLENEQERQLERQLQNLMKRAVELRLTEISTSKLEELSEALAGEVRALGNLGNRARRERLFRFLSDLGFDAAWVTAGDDVRQDATAESPDSRWKRCQPLVVAAVVGWLSLSFLLLFLAVSAGFAMWASAPTRPGEALVGSVGCFIPSLVTALAGFGISWLFVQEKKALRRRQAARDGVKEIVLQHCLERIQELPRGFSDVKRVVRALAVAGTAELDGIRKGRLLSLLQQSGWLNRESGIDLRGANLQGASLGGAHLSRAILRHADLSWADLSRADLQQADLRECDLREADFRVAELSGADLRGADLRGARLQQARLGSAKLEQALLDGAQLWGADLRDTVLDDSRSAPTNRDTTRG